MLAGLEYSSILRVLRCWNTSKKVIILPELSMDQWRSPIWTRQMTEIQNKWSWIQVLQPAIWDIAGDGQRIATQGVNYIWDWEGPEEMLKAIHIESQNITHNNHVGSPTTAEGSVQFHDKVPSIKHQRHPKRGPTRPSRECTLLSGTKVPTFPQGNRFPKECTLLSGTKGINHLASGCDINAEKSLVSS
jgi:hypothetical protein